MVYFPSNRTISISLANGAGLIDRLKHIFIKLTVNDKSSHCTGLYYYTCLHIVDSVIVSLSLEV